MSTLPDVVAGLAVGVSFDGGHTWARRVIGTTGDPLGEICCDEQLAWDRFGNLWMTYLLNTSGDVLRRAFHGRGRDLHEGRRHRDERRPAVDRGRAEQRLGQLHELSRNSDQGIRGARSPGSGGSGPSAHRRASPPQRPRRLRRHCGRAERPGHGDLPGRDQRSGRLQHLHGGRSRRPRIGRISTSRR